MGCHHQSNTLYKDSKEIPLTSIRWDSNDLNEIAKKMVQELLNSSIVFNNEKIYYFANIKNESHDHIDTMALKNKIATTLMKSKECTISTKTSPKMDYLFRGKISSIFKKNSTHKDMFFTLNLILTDTQSSKVIWSHDIEIRKLYERKQFDW